MANKGYNTHTIEWSIRNKWFKLFSLNRTLLVMKCSGKGRKDSTGNSLW